MHFPLVLAATLLGVAPVAHVDVFGPSQLAVGVPAILETTGTVGDFPPLIKVVPEKGVKTLSVGPAGDIAFVANTAGKYKVIVTAVSYADDKKTSLVADTAIQEITVGTPTPPPAPVPTDPFLAAGVAFKNDFDAAYSAAYGAASAAATAHTSLVAAKTALSSSIANASSAAFKNRFAQWVSQLTPAGQEPTSDAQWTLEANVSNAISKAFAQ